MRYLTHIVFLFLLPATTYSQTAHVDSNRIVYKGTVKVDRVNRDELYARAKNALLNNPGEGKEVIVTDSSEKGMISAKGSIRLPSAYATIKTVEYILELSVGDGNYKYRIDSVYLKQVERGGTTNKISSEEILNAMNTSNTDSANEEIQYNHIHINFQKLLDLRMTNMTETSTITVRNN